MPLSYNDWKATAGWNVIALGVGVPPSNPWNVAITHKLTFHGTGGGVLGTDVIYNANKGANDGDGCQYSGIDATHDKVTVTCKVDGKTYTITRTVKNPPVQLKDILRCDGGRSGLGSWTSEEGG